MNVFSLHRSKKLLLLPFLLITLLLIIATFIFTVPHRANAQQAATQPANLVVKQVSTDPYTNSTSQHQTQVEPDTFSEGPVVVSAFQSGRFNTGGGASGINWSTSFDAGLTWKSGILPGLTVYNNGTYARVSDPVVGYDLAHHTWIISSLVAKTTFDSVVGSTTIVVSHSLNGLTWSAPTLVATSGANNNYDKDWIVCDQHPASKFYGRCYEQWDDAANNGQILMSYSNDGGLTWSSPQSPTSQSFFAQGGQPLVQPNGNVIVPIYGFDLTTGAESIYSYRSTDGGTSWTDLMQIDPLKYSTTVAQFYRGGSLPSAEIDQSGKVYVAWAGCYFEANCGTDDIVLATTTDGLTWSPLQRIPLDAIGSNVEHLTAGIAVDRATSGNNAHLAVTYYYWPNAGCTSSTCQIYAGIATSANGGTSWGEHQTIGGPMAATWWANTDAGYMTGDYISTSIAFNRAVTVVPIAKAPNGQQLFQSMYGASASIVGGTLPCETLNTTAIRSQVLQKNTAKKMQYQPN